MEICPVCGNQTLVKESHCSTCIACGYSKCEDKDVDIPSELEFEIEEIKLES